MNDFFEDEIKNVVHVIKGDCVGIALFQRGKNDSHICWQLLVEDDGSWYVSEYGHSSFYIPDLEGVISKMQDWLKKNAVFEKYGWELK